MKPRKVIFLLCGSLFISSSIFTDGRKIISSESSGAFTGIIFRRVRDDAFTAILAQVKSDIGEFTQKGAIRTLSIEEAKALAERDGKGIKTEFGSYDFNTRIKSRSAPRTLIIGSGQVRDENLNPVQKEIAAKVNETLAKVKEYMLKKPFYHTRGYLGENPEWTPESNLYVSAVNPENVRLNHMVAQTLFTEGKGKKQPNYKIVYIPEWPANDLQILRFPEIGVTYVLGSDYYGEAKKGFLTQDGWDMKTKEGRLSLHAGARIDHVFDVKTGKIKKVGTLLLGLSATGKTTLTVHNLGLDPARGEESLVVQDDFTSVLSNPQKDSTRPFAIGKEDGFYLKTDGLNPLEQPLIWEAATKPSAIFENVAVNPVTGKVNFNAPGPDDTTNQRGIMKRRALVLGGRNYFTEEPNMPPLSELDEINVVFITRQNTIIPPISQLNLEQAAAFFMLGESVHSSASTSKKELWGKPVNEVGTNPFIVGSQTQEGNVFYSFLKNLPKEKVRAFLVNTGKIGANPETGEGGEKITVSVTTTILRETLRGTIEWQKEPLFGTLVPVAVPGLDMTRFDPRRFFHAPDLLRLAAEKYDQRMGWLANFPGLDAAMLSALKPPGEH